ncbi:hypothetical protein V8G54_037545 [Vigna mungo]|uniref:Uncharacterized protein n=1 Tax=Vigna mungo TaxID=3915 RepID=A0AAQ3MJC4_VIGMU
MVLHFTDQRHTLIRDPSPHRIAHNNSTPRVGSILAILIPIIRMTQIRVILLHEPDHSIIPKTNLLELILSEVIRIIPTTMRVFQSVEQRLRILLGSCTINAPPPTP